MEYQNPQNERVIIVIAGPPCTGKSEIAKHLGKWVPTSVLYIDDFLCAVSLEKGYTVESPPSSEEAKRLYNVAFDSLCNVATLEDRCFKRGNPSLLDAINFLMGDGGYTGFSFFFKLRRSLMRKKLAAVASRDRSKYLCTSRCIFKYWDKLGDEDNDYKCGVCDDQVASGQPAYTCYYCILALHKSCAELHGLHRRLDAPCCFPETYPCRSCKEGGKGFSGECTSCLFQTHLKCRLVPAIIKRKCDIHFLSLNFSNDKDVVCKACGVEPFSYAYGCSAYVFYGCYICNRFYDIRCASLPVELEHVHGGYEHVMELEYYYREGMTEESCWCNICYKDMDPEYWFYTCQQCPFYSAHTRCAVPLNEYEERDEKRYYESISLEDVDRNRVV